MLGQLRMTVLDCLEEYETLGHRVFGKPRHLHSMTIGFGNRTKYDSRKVQEVFEDVAERRGEESDHKVTFKSRSQTCRT